MKKIIYLSVFVVIIFSIAFCNLIKPAKPDISIKDVSLKGLTFSDITLNMVLDFYNPYPVDGKIKSFDWGVDIEDKSLFMSSTPPDNNFQVKANGHAENPFDVKIKYSDLYNIINDFNNKDRFKYTVKGAAGIEVPGYGTFKLPFNKSGELPAIRLKVDVSNFKVGKLKTTMDGFTPKVTSDIGFDVKVKNLTKSALNVSNMKFDFDLGGYNLVKGISGTPKKVSDQEAVYSVTNTVDLTGGLKSLILGGASNYNLKGGLDLDLPSPFGKTTVPFTKQDNINW